MKAPAATIGIRGTIFEVKICASNRDGLADGNCGNLDDGIYFFVPEGSISVSNSSGSQTLVVGQYAYAKDINSAPVLLPGNPGIDFALPNTVQATGSCMVH